MGDDNTAVTPRRLNLMDLVILVAGVAAGLALGRYGVGLLDSWQFTTFVPAVMWGSSVGLALAVALLAMRLRRPRPPWRDLRRQPGLAACVALLAGVILVAYDTVLATWTSPTMAGKERYIAMALLSEWHGRSVLLAWSLVLFCGSWATEPGPIDRMGRALGGAWIVVGLGMTVALWLRSR